MNANMTQENQQIKAISDCYNLLFSTLMDKLMDIAGGNMGLAHSLAMLAVERCRSHSHIEYSRHLDNIRKE